MLFDFSARDYRTDKEIFGRNRLCLANLSRLSIASLKGNGENPNAYDEYIWLGSSYEKIGAIDIDMSGYLKSTDVTAIQNTEIDDIIK